MAVTACNLLIVSKKWSTGRGRFTSVERFCELLDPDFPGYHGQRIKLHPAVSRFFKQHTNSRKTNKYAAPYNSYSFELELWGLTQALKGKPRFVFFPYADYDFFYWQHFKKVLGTKVILWTFFSETELQERFRDLSHFEKADLVLVAGNSQLDWFNQNAPKVNAVYFPIGVDTDFFTPGETYNPMRVVHVGSNRRDFGTLFAAMDIVCEQFPKLELDLIGASTRKKEIPERSYVNFYDQLSDEEYLKFLQSANFAILSLEDGGSSNSLLETSSCGLPLIITSIPNACDYYDDSFSLQFQKGDTQTLFRSCVTLLGQPSLRDSMAINARQKALEYDWLKIRAKFEDLITKL